MSNVVVTDCQIPLIAEVCRDVELISVEAHEITNDLLRTSSATALLVRSTTPVNHDLLDGTNVSFVGSATAGMDHVSPELLGDNGVRIVGSPGCNANAVAEYVMIWLQHLDIQRSATLGIIGFGNVGQRLARYALAKGYRVVINDPPLAEIGFAFPTSLSHATLDELLRDSDVVSVHTPYTTTGRYATNNLLDKRRIEELRRGSLLINTARGGIIDEQALIARVKSSEIQCILDVFKSEPNICFDTADAAMQCTPHIAGYTQTAKNRGALMVLKAFRAHASLHFDVPTLEEIPTIATTSRGDADVIVQHPFRKTWLANPTPNTFEMCRRLTPLRNEHLQPPSWEELNGHSA